MICSALLIFSLSFHSSHLIYPESLICLNDFLTFSYPPPLFFPPFRHVWRCNLKNQFVLHHLRWWRPPSTWWSPLEILESWWLEWLVMIREMMTSFLPSDDFLFSGWKWLILMNHDESMRTEKRGSSIRVMFRIQQLNLDRLGSIYSRCCSVDLRIPQESFGMYLTGSIIGICLLLFPCDTSFQIGYPFFLLSLFLNFDPLNLLSGAALIFRRNKRMLMCAALLLFLIHWFYLDRMFFILFDSQVLLSSLLFFLCSDAKWKKGGGIRDFDFLLLIFLQLCI